jgi:hypothetical protein
MRHPHHYTRFAFLTVVPLLLLGYLVAACGPSEVAFAVKHLRDITREQITEVVSYQGYPGLDNSAGTAPLQVQLEFERDYRYQIVERLNSEGVSGQSVRNKIVELYKLPPNDPEGEVQKALCPVSVIIPAGNRAIVTVEWTERWAEGVINEGTEGEGDQLGTYSVFLGFVEPCSLIEQENLQ